MLAYKPVFWAMTSLRSEEWDVGKLHEVCTKSVMEALWVAKDRPIIPRGGCNYKVVVSSTSLSDSAKWMRTTPLNDTKYFLQRKIIRRCRGKGKEISRHIVERWKVRHSILYHGRHAVLQQHVIVGTRQQQPLIDGGFRA